MISHPVNAALVRVLTGRPQAVADETAIPLRLGSRVSTGPARLGGY